MIIDEEKIKYKIIKQKLINFEEDLKLSIQNVAEISDPDLAFSMFNMYNRTLSQYIKNKNKPYFAKIVFKQNNSETDSIAYIGRIGFTNLNDDDIIVDWRAPIAELYYNSKLGNASFYIDKEKIDGELKLKRQIVFTNGEITSVYDINNSISSDEFLAPYLTQASDNRLTNIISTIQKEQDEIIRLPLYSTSIVQGVAGSGKTTVALHRLSYLIYNYRKSIKAENYFILTPNNIFKQYITSLLSDLDADLAKSTRIEDILQTIVGKCYVLLNKHSQHSYLNDKNINSEYLSFKCSNDFKKIIDKYIVDLEIKYFKKDIIVNNIVLLSAEDSYDIYTKSKCNSIEEKTIMWASRVNNKIQTDQNLLDKIKEKLKNNEITFKDKLETERIIKKGITNQLKSFFKKKLDIVKLYKDFITQIKQFKNEINISETNLQNLEKETILNLNKKVLSYDDFGAVFYLAVKLYKYDDYTKIKHVLIDEAQDLSYLMFTSLKILFSDATFSIFGDLAQALYSYQSIESWEEILPIFDDVNLMHLNKSYRTTIEIMEKSNEILTLLNLPVAKNVIRHGDQVEHIYCKNIEEMIENQIANFKKTNLNTFAIICKNENEINTLKNKLKIEDINLLNENDNNLQTKINLLTVDSSKGLEFDVVVIFNESSYDKSNKLDLNKLYVAETRALHKLIINQLI